MENSDSQDLYNDAHPEPKKPRLDVLAHVPTNLNRNDLYYSMKKEKRGRAIIFSHESYEEIDGIEIAEPRDGTVEDVKRLSSTFSGLGFEIDLQKNRTYEQIREHILQESGNDELENYDCLVVIVLTHGGECEEIYAKDRTYNVKELVEPFTGRSCIQLANKPKLFFIQACKGPKLQGEIPLVFTDSSLVSDANKPSVIYSIPEISDVLVAYATIEGYVALRCAEWGSPYIQCLCEELDRRATDENLLNILTRVHKRLSNAVFILNKTNKSVKIQPSFLSYLNRFVCFDAPSFRPQTQ